MFLLVMFFAIDRFYQPQFWHHIMDYLPEVSPSSGEWWWGSGCCISQDAGAIASSHHLSIAIRRRVSIAPNPLLLASVPYPLAAILRCRSFLTPSNCFSIYITVFRDYPTPTGGCHPPAPTPLSIDPSS
ncbi:hypothetical protein [[Phormidium] sp. ETS-05]|uniref:hypothetical protein n=1 Tax=[Phormidium] sp. ETS-05 TaxID=222819 RepID=UPI0018EEE93E|nr:hypothetical protein [[Phormidium] sp. ETS-05]